MVWCKRLFLAAIILLVIVVIYHVYLIMSDSSFSLKKTRKIKSSVDGMEYLVHPGDECHSAADTLAKLNSIVIMLMAHLRKKYIRSKYKDMYPERHKAVKNLLSRYNPDNLTENSPNDPEGDTAYSLDKGAIVAICIRDKRPEHFGQIHDIGILTFVTIHEMAHIAIDAFDHPPEFWSTFKFLLNEAHDAGIFTSPDYRRNPVHYCGMKVDYSPVWDRSTQAI